MPYLARQGFPHTQALLKQEEGFVDGRHGHLDEFGDGAAQGTMLHNGKGSRCIRGEQVDDVLPADFIQGQTHAKLPTSLATHPNAIKQVFTCLHAHTHTHTHTHVFR